MCGYDSMLMNAAVYDDVDVKWDDGTGQRTRCKSRKTDGESDIESGT